MIFFVGKGFRIGALIWAVCFESHIAILCGTFTIEVTHKYVEYNYASILSHI